jgi:iron complex outermembrane receptor protein
MSRDSGSGVDAGTGGVRSVRRAVALALASAAGIWAGGAHAQESAAPGVVQLEDVIVVGTRLRSTGLADSHSPVTVFDAEDIARTGGTSISDVLEYLPSKTLGLNDQASPGGAQLVQLRGLAVGNTLVLINGRRTTTTATLGGFGPGFNLNTIPLSAVERIEVLSDSSSAVYGADAVGGVVNLVLKRSLQAPVVSAYFGKAEGGADESRGSAGFGMDGERLRFSVIGDFFKRDYLMGSERDRSANQDFRGQQGGTDARSNNSKLANVASQNGANLPGLSSPRATVPAGSTGTLTPADFAATAGQINRVSLGQFQSIVPQSERYSGTALADLKLTDGLSMFGEVIYSKQEDERRNSPNALPGGANGAVVPANQAFNPFDVPLLVNYLFPDPVVSYTDNELIRGVLGVRGTLGRSWDWEVYGLNSSENGVTSQANVTNATAVTAALRSTNPATALNVFTDAPLDPALAALLYSPSVENRFSSDNTQGSAFVRGSLFELPGGAVSAVLGAEWRREGVHVEATNINLTQDRNVKSGFAEARIPLVGDKMTVPAVRRLTATLAVRYDDYSDFGDTTNPQYGLEWAPIQDLLLRASYGDAYRAPTLFDLFQAPATFQVPQTDALRPGAPPAQVTLITGGNPNLQPEESTTLSTGIVYTPGALPGFRAAITYFKIQQEQRLQRFNQNTFLANEAFFADRIIRAAPNAADIAAGRPGALQSIDLSNLHSGSLDTDGIDLELSASFATGLGTFAPTLSSTLITSYDAADFPGAVVTDRLDSANTQGAIPKVRATGSLAWSLKGYGVTPIVRYISSYDDVNTLNLATGTQVDSQVLVDLQASLDFETAFNAGAWTDGLSLRIGVLNVLDEEAPFALIGGQNGYDTSQADLRGRFGYLTLQKTFW